MEDEEIRFYEYGIILDPAMTDFVTTPQLGITIPIRIVIDDVPQYTKECVVKFYSQKKLSPQQVLRKFKGTKGIRNIIWESYD